MCPNLEFQTSVAPKSVSSSVQNFWFILFMSFRSFFSFSFSSSFSQVFFALWDSFQIPEHQTRKTLHSETVNTKIFHFKLRLFPDPICSFCFFVWEGRHSVGDFFLGVQGRRRIFFRGAEGEKEEWGEGWRV